ncbi:MAG: DUF3108 domain-containing protein [Flavobacteriaceae bacterium]|nr:DUF3108 domain-containing protein [Flavobacteriaceae bacterium]
MRKLILIAILLLNLPLAAQNTAIGSNEKLTFTASYRMSGLLTDLAQITMETSEVNSSGSTLLRLKCKARTFSKWDNFFKINDLYESYVSAKTLKPYLYKREINEGSYYKFMQYKYKHKTGEVESLRRKRRKNGTFWDENQTLSIGSGTLDIVSLIYHIRNLDIHKATSGSTDTFTVLFDNAETPVTIKLIGQETKKTKLGNIPCYKLSIAVNTLDVLKGTNANLLWLSADANKIPVFAKFKVAVGSGELRLEEATGLKHSL